MAGGRGFAGCSGVCEGLRNFQMHEVTLISVSPAAFQGGTETGGVNGGREVVTCQYEIVPSARMYLHV